MATALQEAMKSSRISIRTSAREEIQIVTSQVNHALRELSTGEGICTLVTPHTTCAVTVNENADPDVPADLIRALRAMIPEVRFDHGEGNSDAHLLSAIIGCSVSLPFLSGKLVLGRWQGIYFVELDGPRERHLDVYVVE